MYTVRGTKKFLDRVGSPIADPPSSTTALGDWYAKALWRPQAALFVSTATFVAVLMPLAPAARVVARFPLAMAEVFGALGVDPRFVEAEMTDMSSVVLAKTASRQVLGVMNELTFMAEHSISTGCSDPADLLGVSVWLANTIVGPISKEDGYSPIGAIRRNGSARPLKRLPGLRGRCPANPRSGVTCGLSDPRSHSVLRPSPSPRPTATGDEGGPSTCPSTARYCSSLFARDAAGVTSRSSDLAILAP